MSTVMGHECDVPRLWSERTGEIAAKQNKLAEGAYVTGQGLEETRQAYRAERAFWNEDDPSVAVCVDQKVPTRCGAVRVCHYRPDEQRPLSLIAFVHGGGWVIGDVDTHDRITRILCHLTGAAIVSIDYTLAPGAHFPQQIHECRNVVAHIREQAEEWGITPEDISFAGDSAGANVAAATMLMIRGEGVLTQTRTMLLFYGTYGLKDSMSVRLLGGAWDGLTEADYAYYSDQYFAEPENADDPHFNVLGSDSSMGALPCYIVAAGLDPLRDDSRTLVEVFGLCSVPHLYSEIGGVIRSFLHHSKMLDQTMDVLRETTRFYAEHPVHRRAHTLTHRK